MASRRLEKKREALLCAARPRCVMADRKAKTITVKFPCTATVNDVKTALAKEGEVSLTCVQDLGAGEFLIEFVTKEEAEDYIDSGVDFHEIHLQCNPPHGYHVNMSILGLKAYVDDEKVIEALSEYGKIKSEVIRLKYRADHDLAGIENGKRLVPMVVTKVSIPYSLRIDGQWCPIIHNNQQRVCSFVNASKLNVWNQRSHRSRLRKPTAKFPRWRACHTAP